MGIARFTMLLCASFGLAAPAGAAVVIGEAVSGSAVNQGGVFQRIAPPPAVGQNNLQSLNLIAFDERQRFVLSAGMVPTIGGPIAAGTRVSSHVVAFDPVASRRVEGWVRFDGRVIGIITTRAGLVATNAWLGAPGTLYNMPGGVGLEGNDFAVVDPVDPWRVNLRMSAGSPGDLIRVITAVVPEPRSWALMLAGFGLIGLSMRRSTGLPRVRD